MRLKDLLNAENHRKLVELKRKTGKSYEELMNEMVNDYYGKSLEARIESFSDHELRKAFEKNFIKDGELTETGYLFIKYYYLEAAKNIVKIVLALK